MREKRSWPGQPGASVNVEVRNKCIADFCKSYNFRSLITKPICFKNSEHPSCIDLVLTNSHIVFNVGVLLRHHLHKMTAMVSVTDVISKVAT